MNALVINVEIKPSPRNMTKGLLGVMDLSLLGWLLN